MTKCIVAAENGGFLIREHKPNVGQFKGLPRLHCQQCGQWLEPEKEKMSQRPQLPQRQKFPSDS